MDLGISGRVALVLGASQGIGRAVAVALASEGARVAVASRSLPPLERLAGEIGGAAFAHDNDRPEDAPALVAAVGAALGPIDILVTNTGGPRPDPDPLSYTRDEWEEAHRALLLSPIALIEAVMPGMRERGFGRIVNVGSFTVREPVPTLMLSNSYRSATLAAFKTISRNVAATGVTVNTVLPGRIATERAIRLAGSQEQAEASARAEVPAARLGTPQELAAAVAFLCSQQAGYITGVGLLVDGGLAHLT